MKRFNSKIYLMHRWLGLVVGAFLLLLSLTGSALVFADEIDLALNSEMLRVEPQSVRMNFDALYRRVRLAFPEAGIRGFRALSEDDGTAYTVNMDLHGLYWFAHIDPYTGRILGDRDADASLVRTLLRLHYSLLWRPWGEALVCVFGFALLASLATGFYIYRHAFWKVFRTGIRWREGLRPATSDLHRLIGVSGLVFNAVIAVTGAWMLLPVFPHLVQPQPPVTWRPYAFHLSIDDLIEQASERLPGFRMASILLPQAPGEQGSVYGYVPGGNPLLGRYSSWITFDGASGAVVAVHDGRAGTAREKWDSMAGPLHFGNFGGLPVKIFYCVFGLTPAILSLSGFVLWRARMRHLAPEAKGSPLSGGPPKTSNDVRVPAKRAMQMNERGRRR